MQPETVPDRASPEGEALPPYRERIRDVVGRLAAKMGRDLEEGGFGTGEVAELRRMDAAQGAAATSLTFWRIVVEELEANKLVGKQAGGDLLRPWIVIFRAAAELAGHYRPAERLGRALQQAHVDEKRLVRLLRAEGEDLGEQVRVVVHQIRTAGVDVDVRDLAELVLADATHQRGGSGDWVDHVRRSVASAYFRSEYSESKDNETSAETN